MAVYAQVLIRPNADRLETISIRLRTHPRSTKIFHRNPKLKKLRISVAFLNTYLVIEFRIMIMIWHCLSVAPIHFRYDCKWSRDDVIKVSCITDFYHFPKRHLKFSERTLRFVRCFGSFDADFSYNSISDHVNRNVTWYTDPRSIFL